MQVQGCPSKELTEARNSAAGEHTCYHDDSDLSVGSKAHLALGNSSRLLPHSLHKEGSCHSNPEAMTIETSEKTERNM